MFQYEILGYYCAFRLQLSFQMITRQPEQEHKKSSLFDPDKGFLDLPIVQLCLAILILICLSIVAIISVTRDVEWSVDADGLTNAATWYRVPVGVFTLSLPVFALLAASHRSEQTKQQMWLTRNQIERTDRQIVLTSDQNNFSNYFKHLEEFTKYCDSHNKKSELHVISPRKLHFKIFPDARRGGLSPAEYHATRLTEDVRKFLSICDGFIEPTMHGFRAVELQQNYIELKEYYGLSNKDASGHTWHIGEFQIFVPTGYVRDFIKFHISIFEAIDEILQFDTSYNTPKNLSSLKLLEYSGLPNTALQSSPTFHLRDLLPDSHI